jgi:hypothetical protein
MVSVYKPRASKGSLNSTAIIVQGLFLGIAIFLVLYLSPMFLPMATGKNSLGLWELLSDQPLFYNSVCGFIAFTTAAVFVIRGDRFANVVSVEIDDEKQVIHLVLRKILKRDEMEKRIDFMNFSLATTDKDQSDGSERFTVEFWDHGKKIASIVATNSLLSNSIWDPQRDWVTLNELKDRLKLIQEKYWGKSRATT